MLNGQLRGTAGKDKMEGRLDPRQERVKLALAARRTVIRRDVIAGFELASMSIPQCLGYAAIAGMPAVTGLYALLLPPLGFAILGSSPSLVVAADSATAAILAGGLTKIGVAGTPSYVAQAGLVALLTAVLLVLARILKLGFIADFLSQTVLTGFLSGVGIQIGIGVLGKMLRVPIFSRRSIGQLIELLRQLPAVHLPSLLISAAVIVGVLTLRQFRRRVPWTLLAVVAAIAASAVWNFAAHGITTIGPVPPGLPKIMPPDVGWRDFETLLPLAASCFVMIVTQSAATARIYALRRHQRDDENADLIGLAAANALAAFSGTFVVNGSPSQTAVADNAGARTHVAHASTVAVVALVLLFVHGPLKYMPQCVLGAIVFLVAIRMVDLRGLNNIRRESTGEFALAVTTAVVVVVAGVEEGILIAMVMSLLRIIRYSYHPHTAVLVKEGEMWRTIRAAPGAVSEPGIVIYRFGAPLFYANVRMFSDEIRSLTATPIPWVIVDAGAITGLDYSAARVVEQLQKDLAKRHTQLLFAHVEPGLKEDLDRHHLTELIGPDRIFDKLHDALIGCRPQSP